MLIRFEPQDTLFFREARPMEAQGVKPLGGRFPPPARTVAGAVRSLIGEAMNVNWESYRRDGDRTGHCGIDELIGPPDAEPPGPLLLTGPFPALEGQRLYPAPLHLLRAKNAAGYEYGWLKPGDPVICDLGEIRLPVLDRKLDRAKPLENGWLTQVDFLRVLRGAPPEEPIFTESDEEPSLLAAEPRLGIAMEHPRRGAAEGQLYQTVHARLCPGIGIGVEVIHQDGKALPVPPRHTVRFGGEGRFAHVETSGKAIQELNPGPSKQKPVGIVLVLLTPANFHSQRHDPAWLPPNFTAKESEGATVWQGEIGGEKLTIVSAVIGKAIREGGWDLHARAPRPAETFVPAGSVLFCETTDPVAAASKLARQKLKLGIDTALGRGEIAVGYWFA